jgi:hypothetical protein
MPLSKPLEFVAFRMAPEELARLKKLAGREKLTLSEALRRGATLYMEDAASTSSGVKVAQS